MNRELSFEAMPFEFDSEFPGESFEGESEAGGAQRSPRPTSGLSSASTAGQRPGRNPAFSPARPKKPPVRKPSPSSFRPRGPRRVIREPYGLVSQPYSREPEPSGSEHVRWVQHSLNRILGLRLPLDGIMGPEIRSAIRSFQKREKLPVTGIVGPDTERALMAATASTPASRSSKDVGQELFEYGYYGEIPLGAADYELEEEVNRQSPAYAMWVQQSLNKILGLRLAVDGITGTQTRSAIRSFQQREGLLIDGIVGPQTESALVRAGAGNPPGSAPAPYIPGGWPALPAGRKELSGAIWVSRFPTSRSTNDLEPTFANNVNRFIAALKGAGVSVSIAATYRPKERAHLMHWAWKIAKGAVSAQNVPPMPGVEINWWHGNDADSRRAAQEMVDLYALRYEPSLTSRHIERRAIDMSIYWSGNLQIKKANGQSVLISSSPKDGTNRSLIEVGRSYNVVHFEPSEDDPPHWSVDGR